MLILKAIGVIVLFLFSLITVFALIVWLIPERYDGGRIMLVITYSDTEENLEQLLRNAYNLCLNSMAQIDIVAVYCGIRNVENGESEQYEICRRFAAEHEYVKCITYDSFIQLFSAGENR